MSALVSSPVGCSEGPRIAFKLAGEVAESFSVRSVLVPALAVLTLWAGAAEPAAAIAPRPPHWPDHIARNYEMFSPAGNRAVRHVAWRASRMLRKGASRRSVMAMVRRAYGRVELRYEEAYDTAVCDAFADELDKWLVVAGYERIDAFDEFAF